MAARAATRRKVRDSAAQRSAVQDVSMLRAMLLADFSCHYAFSTPAPFSIATPFAFRLFFCRFIRRHCFFSASPFFFSPFFSAFAFIFFDAEPPPSPFFHFHFFIAASLSAASIIVYYDLRHAAHVIFAILIFDATRRRFCHFFDIIFRFTFRFCLRYFIDIFATFHAGDIAFGIAAAELY